MEIANRSRFHVLHSSASRLTPLYAMRRRERVPRASQPGIAMQVTSLAGLLGRTASIKLTAASSKNRLDQFFRLTAVFLHFRMELSRRFLQGYKR